MNRKERRAAAKQGKGSVSQGEPRAPLGPLFEAALRHHQVGELREANQVCGQILAHNPNDIDALHLSGLIACQVGLPQVGIDLFAKALSLDGRIPPLHYNIAEAYRAVGRLDDAIVHYRRTLGLAPSFAAAHGNLGNVLLQQGKLDDSIAAYRSALALAPDQPATLNNLGAALHRQGKPDEALAAFGQALAVSPGYTEALRNCGNVLFELKRHEDAIASYDRLLAIDPNHAETLRHRGDALFALGRREEALAGYDRALALEPAAPDALNARGKLLRDFGRPEEAIVSYRQALALNPGDPALLSNLGDALFDLGRHEQAIASYDRAIAIAPGFLPALCNRGVALTGRGFHEQALASFERALAIDPGHVEALNGGGIALFELGRHEEALASYERGLAIAPDHAELLSNRGAVLLPLRRLAEALASCDRALGIKPDYAEALSNRGNVLSELERREDALVSYDRALAIVPGHANILSNRGTCLMELGRHEQAAETFAQLLAIDPEFDYARGNLLYAKLLCGDWTDYREDVERLVAGVAAGKRAALPFMFLSFSGSVTAQLECSRAHNRYKSPTPDLAVWQGEKYRHDRIRIAYLSADFRQHAVAYSLAQLFQGHDRSRFHTAGISFGPDPRDPFRAGLEQSFDQFIDVRGQSDRDVALLLRRHEIDIAVDLMGYTQRGRPGIFALRPAPVQVNYLGYLGSTGVEYMDYIVADRTVIPEDQRGFYSEKVAYLPDAFMPSDTRRQFSAQGLSRRAAGLPDSGVVFCALNNTYKITPPIFDIWLRLLERVEGSVLWLLEGDAATVGNRRRYAEGRGVSPDRLVFAPRVSAEEHLARHRLADLFLDTLPYNAGVTACDALWAGLPIVTCRGSGIVGRMAASLLDAVGLPELIADNLADYEALALRLAQAPGLLAATAAKLARNRETFPLFDADRFRRHLESAYTTMWQRYQQGEPPAGFAVEPLPGR